MMIVIMARIMTSCPNKIKKMKGTKSTASKKVYEKGQTDRFTMQPHSLTTGGQAGEVGWRGGGDEVGGGRGRSMLPKDLREEGEGTKNLREFSTIFLRN